MGDWNGRECISYLCGNVIVRRRAHDGETDEEHIGLGIGQGPESIIILLTCSVPKTQADRLAIDNDASRVVVKPVTGEPKVNNQYSQAQVGSVMSEGGTNTVGMYSPGKAFVVYEIRRQVCATEHTLVDQLRRMDREMVATYLADGTVTGHDTLEETGGVSIVAGKKN